MIQLIRFILSLVMGVLAIKGFFNISLIEAIWPGMFWGMAYGGFMVYDFNKKKAGT